MAEIAEELVLVHLIFRHGDRTPDLSWIYPKESHIDRDFLPYGPGQLTNEGKRTMYNLGSALRTRYKHFLDESYTPGIIEARSTSSDRTKISLQLVLASLYKPVGDLIWSNDLNWLPVPFSYSPIFEDTLLGSFVNREFNQKFSNNISDGSLDERIRERLQAVIPEVEEHTGLTIHSTRQLWGLSEHIKSEETCGMELPEWCRSDVMKRLREVALLHYGIQMSSKENQRFLLGDFLKKLMDDTKRKIEENSKVKMHIYSGHEMNVVNFLLFLNMWEPHVPPYGSCVALEVYKTDQQYVVKIAYKMGKDGNFDYLPFSNHEVACNVEKFEDIINKLNCVDTNNNNLKC